MDFKAESSSLTTQGITQWDEIVSTKILFLSKGFHLILLSTKYLGKKMLDEDKNAPSESFSTPLWITKFRLGEKRSVAGKRFVPRILESLISIGFQ